MVVSRRCSGCFGPPSRIHRPASCAPSLRVLDCSDVCGGQPRWVGHGHDHRRHDTAVCAHQSGDLSSLCNLQGFATRGTFFELHGLRLFAAVQVEPVVAVEGTSPTISRCWSWWIRRGLIIRIKLSENRRDYTPVARGPKKWQREYNRRRASERVFGRMKDVIDIEDTGLRGLARAQMRGALGALILLAHAVACLREGRAQHIRSLKRA